MGQVSSIIGLAGSGAALLAVFMTFFYLYQFSPNKPDLAGIAAELAGGIISKNAKADP